MVEIGHNKPPDMCVTAGEVTNDLSRWMAEHPVIQTEEEAKEAKVFIDRANLCVKDMEDERKAQTGPLNEAVKKINESYRGPRELLERVEGELKSRTDRYLVGVEQGRIEAAERARALAENAERVAREAERTEQDALGSAAAGELDVNVADVTRSADAAFADYLAAQRAAELAERAQKVKVTGGFTRALSLKNRQVPIVDDPIAALTELHETVGLTDYMHSAIIRQAVIFKRKFGRLPNGIRIEIERRS